MGYTPIPQCSFRKSRADCWKLTARQHQQYRGAVYCFLECGENLQVSCQCRYLQLRWPAIFYLFILAKTEDKLQSPISLETYLDMIWPGSGSALLAFWLHHITKQHRSRLLFIFSYWLGGGIFAREPEAKPRRPARSEQNTKENFCFPFRRKKRAGAN